MTRDEYLAFRDERLPDLRHIAALEARTPAPTLPTFDLHGEPFKPLPILDLPDQQQDLAPEIQQLISSNMDALAEKPAPAMPADMEALLAEAEEEAAGLSAYEIAGSADVLRRLATALRETLAREQADLRARWEACDE